MPRQGDVEERGVSRDMQGACGAQCLARYLTLKDTAGHKERKKSSSQNVEDFVCMHYRHFCPNPAGKEMPLHVSKQGSSMSDGISELLSGIWRALSPALQQQASVGVLHTQGKRRCPGAGDKLRHSGFRRLLLGMPRNVFL